MGLAARMIEDTGIATATLTITPNVTRKVNPPRALYVKSQPRGETVGAAGDVSMQRQVVESALRLLESATPGELAEYGIDH